jgi:uncharacterized protein (TIGR02284 family)
METGNELESVVHHLIEITNERKEGYKTASENVKDQEIASLFDDYAEQSDYFAYELAKYDKHTPEEVGTRAISGAWRVWMDLKGALSRNEEKALIEASITGEEIALKNYREALNNNLPEDLREIVSRQYQEIQEACDNIKAFKRKVS